MLIRLDNNPEHLGGLQTLFVNQFRPDIEKLRKRMLNNLIKFFSLLVTLESIYAANGQQTLQASVDGARIVGP